MLVAHIELTDSNDITPLTDWFEDHSTASIQRITNSGFHFYIFYTE